MNEQKNGHTFRNEIYQIRNYFRAERHEARIKLLYNCTYAKRTEIKNLNFPYTSERAQKKIIITQRMITKQP